MQGTVTLTAGGGDWHGRHKAQQDRYRQHRKGLAASIRAAFRRLHGIIDDEDAPAAVVDLLDTKAAVRTEAQRLYAELDGLAASLAQIESALDAYAEQARRAEDEDEVELLLLMA